MDMTAPSPGPAGPGRPGASATKSSLATAPRQAVARRQATAGRQATLDRQALEGCRPWLGVAEAARALGRSRTRVKQLAVEKPARPTLAWTQTHNRRLWACRGPQGIWMFEPGELIRFSLVERHSGRPPAQNLSHETQELPSGGDTLPGGDSPPGGDGL